MIHPDTENSLDNENQSGEYQIRGNVGLKTSHRSGLSMDNSPKDKAKICAEGEIKS